jgi:tetratricopeptide (TPR) repeat protein
MPKKKKFTRKNKKKKIKERISLCNTETLLPEDKNSNRNLEEIESSLKEATNFPSKNYPKKHLFFEVLLLVLATIALYVPTLNYAFHLDDQVNIWGNSYIQISSLSIDELIKAGFESPNNKRPVANISFALNYYFNGLNVNGFHIVNILIHALTGIILFYFVKITISLPLIRDKLGEYRLVPFFTAIIWLVHPLHTQSVTYIVQRMNSMAAMFFIMSMLFYVNARLAPERVKKIMFFVFSFIAGIFALGSKQNTATLPLFILLYEWYFFQDLRLKTSKKQLFLIAVLGCLFGFVLFFFLGGSPLSKLFPDYSGRPFTMAQRLLTQSRVVLHYISLLIYPSPARLNLDYDFLLSNSLFSPPTTFVAILMIVGMLGFSIYAARKNRLYSFCILWFLGNLVIESSTIPLEIIYEHRTYLPSMMVIFLFVILLYQGVKNKYIFITFLVSLALFFSFWTYNRNAVWQDGLSLWTDCQAKSPNKPRVNQNFGGELLSANRVEEAILVLQKALYLYKKQVEFQKNVNPHKTSDYLSNLANAYRVNGEYNKAIFYYNKALEEYYYSARIHYPLGLCYAKIGRLEEAIYHYKEALKQAPYSPYLGVQSNISMMKKSLDNAVRMLNFIKKTQIQN